MKRLIVILSFISSTTFAQDFTLNVGENCVAAGKEDSKEFSACMYRHAGLSPLGLIFVGIGKGAKKLWYAVVGNDEEVVVKPLTSKELKEVYLKQHPYITYDPSTDPNFTVGRIFMYMPH